MIIYLVIFASLSLAMLVLFRVDQRQSDTPIRISEILRDAKRELIIERKPGRLSRLRLRWLHLLQLSRIPPLLYSGITAAAFLVGCTLGMAIFSDLPLGLFVGLCSLPLPLIYLLLYSRKYARQEAEHLEELMSSVTHAYLATNSIIAAFESYNNMRNKGLDPRLRRIGLVDEFLIDVHAINPSVVEGLRKMQGKISNRYFDDWVNMLIRCNKNKELRFGLQPIIKAFNDSKIMQLEAETTAALVWREYFLVVVMLFGIIPVLRLSNEAWYNILTQSLVGRMLVCAMIAATLGASFYVLRVTRPLD